MVKDCRRGRITNHPGIKQIIFHQWSWEFRSRGKSEDNMKMENPECWAVIQIIPTAVAGSHGASSSNQNLPRPLINLFTWFVSDAFSDFFRPLRTLTFFSLPFLNSISTLCQGRPALFRALASHLALACANRRYQPLDMFCLASISRGTWLH